MCPVPLMLGGRRLPFTFFNCVIMTVFGLFHMGAHMKHTCPFSLSSRNKYICKHFYRLRNCNLPVFTSVSFLCPLKLTQLMACSLFVTFGQYSNVYIFCDSANWLTSGWGQVSRFWEAVAELEPRHLFLILWSYVAYQIFFSPPAVFSHLSPCLRGKSVLESLGGSIFLVLLGLHGRIHVCLIDGTEET